jgi:uncharacterized protein
MQKEKIPTLDECYSIMSGRMLPNIKEHSEQVMNVALAIFNNLKSDTKTNKELIIAASLLHDITKTESLSTKEPHDITGGILVRKLGYNDVAAIIEEHIFLKNFNPDGKLLEKEIVYYADKRVMHNKIVSLDERISDLIIRYAQTNKRKQQILKNKESILRVQNKINKYMKNDIDEIIFGLNNK